MSKPTKSGAPAQRTTTIVTRAGKGAPLTWDEHDANHVNAAATADQALAAAGTGGAGDALDIPYTTVVPLDKPGFGKRMALHVLATNETLTQGAGAVQDGNCALYFQQNSTGGFMVALPTSWQNKGTDVLDMTSNAKTELMVTNQQGSTLYAWVALGAAAAGDTTPPSEVSATVSNATPTMIEVLFDEDLNQSLGASALFSAFAVTAGHPLTASAWGNTVRKVNLTTSAAFVNGEATTALAFTQSGSVGLQDAAGNKVASFTAKQITNNVAAAGDVTPPTLTSAAVDTATPTHIQLSWSEPVDSAIAAPTAFGVSGHTVTDHVMWNSTLTYLVLSAPFVAGETTQTVSYTQPATNPMADLANNKAVSFSGVTIANGLASSTLFADTFDRTNGVIGTSSHGDVWTSPDSGGSSSPIQVVSNKASITPGASLSWASLDTLQTTYTVSADVVAGNNDDFAGIMFRSTHNFSDGRCRFFLQYGRVTLGSLDWDGTGHVLAEYDGGYDTSGGGTTYNLKVVVTPTTLQAFVDGVSVIDAISDASYAAQTCVGISIANKPASNWDNFLVTTP